MTRQVPVGWEVAAGRRSFSAVSFRIRCFCAGTSDPFVALLRRIFCEAIGRLNQNFLRILLRFSMKDFSSAASPYFNLLLSFRFGGYFYV